ncbi:MAG: phosphatidylglycerol lysyltransferase domain-containing protein [Tannerella sp.]|jgi:hypothetical protein|nr:phosphatidylglycerol lysyltransferase domain-containing protein [Tannerella sp.]
MSIPFKAITLADKEAITAYTLNSPFQNCDYSFANMCSWRFLYGSEYAIYDEMLLVRFWIEEKRDRPVYMCPVSRHCLDEAVRLLEEDSLAHGHPLWLLGVTDESRKVLERDYPGGFRYIPDRNYSDYIYLRSDLAGLSGKRYQSKRNHVNRFRNLYDYRYLPITPELVPHCLELEAKWFVANEEKEGAGPLSNERRSLTFALAHSEELGLQGGAICVEGEIIAFSFGAPINANTFGVHVEKADVHYEGAYSVINQEFASHIPAQYTYVNREEDLGIPGLRQAKLSYHPAILLDKYTAIKKPVAEL